MNQEQNQNQNQTQLFVTRVAITGLKNLENGNYALTMKREWSNGSIDNDSQSPPIAEDKIDEYLETHIKVFGESIKAQKKELEEHELVVIENNKHFIEQIEILEGLVKERKKEEV